MSEWINLFHAWLRYAVSQGDLSKSERTELVNRLDGSHGDLRDVIRRMADNELLVLWGATVDWDNEDIIEMGEFIWGEMLQRSRKMIALTA